jgi:hypothetical protein
MNKVAADAPSVIVADDLSQDMRFAALILNPPIPLTRDHAWLAAGSWKPLPRTR